MDTIAYQKALVKYIGNDKDSLLEEIGIRQLAILMNPAIAGEVDPTVTHDTATMGALDDVRELGRRLYRRWSKELYKIVCGGDDADKEDRQAILSAVGLADVAIGAAMTSILVSLGLAPALAAILAALVVKRIVVPAGDELCVFWGEELEKEK